MNTPTSNSSAVNQAGGQIRLVKGEDGGPPQLITLSHLQNFLPLAAAAAAQAGQPQQDGNQVQGNPGQQGKLVQTQGGVLSVGLPQQFLQVSLFINYIKKFLPSTFFNFP